MPDFQPLSGLVGRLPTTFGQQSAPGEIDKNGFLKLLIEQMKNQDPLNPMDSQEYASSLAQFSQLEEIQNLNSSTDQGVQANIMLAQSINNTLAATLVGKSVKAIGSQVVVDHDGGRDISFDMGTAGKVNVTITNASGEVVRTIEHPTMSAGEHTIEWDGKDDDGKALADGTYDLSVNVVAPDGTTSEATPFVLGNVSAVRYDATGAVLVVDGMRIGFGDVLEVRDTITNGANDGFGSIFSSLGL